MRILVVGLGGVGGYIAAHLAQTGHEIVGVARGEHLKVIQENGLHSKGALHVSQDEGDFVAHFQACEAKDLSGVFDIILFCVKSYDLEAAVLACKPFMSQSSTLLCLSNGVEHGDTLRSLTADTLAKVLDGCVYILAHVQKAGHIQKLGNVFSLVCSQDARLAMVLEEAGLRYKMPENIQEAIWRKYIFIATFGVLTAFFDMPIKAVYEAHYAEVKEYLQAVCAIAKAKGTVLDDEIEKSLQTASKLPPAASTSMHKDIKAHKKDELETLCGYLVREAKRLGVNALCVEKYYAQLLKLHQ